MTASPQEMRGLDDVALVLSSLQFVRRPGLHPVTLTVELSSDMVGEFVSGCRELLLRFTRLDVTGPLPQWVAAIVEDPIDRIEVETYLSRSPVAAAPVDVSMESGRRLTAVLLSVVTGALAEEAQRSGLTLEGLLGLIGARVEAAKADAGISGRWYGHSA